jgi:hypothetical protein
MHGRTMLGVAAAVALLTAAFVGTAFAQSSGSQTVQLTPSRGSGVTGTATLTDTGGGVQVAVQVQGAPAGEHPAHIHAGATCADDRAGQGAPVEFPLNNVVVGNDGSGSSTTVVSGVTVAGLFSGDQARYINVHALPEGQGVPPGIACADLVSTGVTMPATGGISPLALALYGGVALVSLGAATTFLALRTRRA